MPPRDAAAGGVLSDLPAPFLRVRLLRGVRLRVSWSCHTFLSVSSLVNECANDAADNRSAEDGEAVAAVVDVNDRRRRWRRGRRRGRRRNPAAVMMVVMRGCAMMCGCAMMRGCAMMDGCAFRSATVMRSGHCRAAEGHTRECRDCHCLDRLVHVTPTFPGFLPLHKVRRTGRRFLTQEIRFKLPIALPCRLEGAASDNNDSSLANS